MIKRVFLFLLHAPKTSQEKPQETPSFKRRREGVDPQEETETWWSAVEERAEGWMQLKIGLTKHLRINPLQTDGIPSHVELARHLS